MRRAGYHRAPSAPPERGGGPPEVNAHVGWPSGLA